MDEQLLAEQGPASATTPDLPHEDTTVIVVDVHFKSGGKTYYFDPSGLEIQDCDHDIIYTV